MGEVIGSGLFAVAAVVVGWMLARGSERYRRRATIREDLEIWAALPDGELKSQMLQRVEGELKQYLGPEPSSPAGAAPTDQSADAFLPANLGLVVLTMAVTGVGSVIAVQMIVAYLIDESSQVEFPALAIIAPLMGALARLVWKTWVEGLERLRLAWEHSEGRRSR